MTVALDVAATRRIGEFDLDVAFTMESGLPVLFGPSGAGKIARSWLERAEEIGDVIIGASA
ncbi:MAG: hypothetical protein ABSH29_01460 [Acidimicrobiales bacterium]|jgi:ABC-type molybdate transport system ATPase subunit